MHQEEVTVPPTLSVVRCHEVIQGDGAHTAEDLVTCKERHASVPLTACLECERLAGFDGSVVRCRPRAEPLEKAGNRSDRRSADFREAALRVTVGELMQTRCMSITADASVEALEALLEERHVRAATVVDLEGKPVGIVSSADLLRFRGDPPDRPEETCPTELGPAFHVEEVPVAVVAEIMTPVVHALPEDAPLAYAFGLFADKDLREVPIVANDGRVVGMLTSTDLLRWAARDLGYVL